MYLLFNVVHITQGCDLSLLRTHTQMSTFLSVCYTGVSVCFTGVSVCLTGVSVCLPASRFAMMTLLNCVSVCFTGISVCHTGFSDWLELLHSAALQHMGWFYKLSDIMLCGSEVYNWFK